MKFIIVVVNKLMQIVVKLWQFMVTRIFLLNTYNKKLSKLYDITIRNHDSEVYTYHTPTRNDRPTSNPCADHTSDLSRKKQECRNKYMACNHLSCQSYLVPPWINVIHAHKQRGTANESVESIPPRTVAIWADFFPTIEERQWNV